DEVVLRPATMADLSAIGDLIRRAEAHDGVPRVQSDEELDDDLGAPYVDLALDTRVAEVGGHLVGWARVWHPEATAVLDRADLVGEVAPEHRGRGLGRVLLGWSVERARQRLDAATHDLPRHLRVEAYDWLQDRHRLYRRFGFRPVRWNEVLVRPLDDLPSPPPPEGVRIEPWPDHDTEALEVRNAAFADHRGSMAIPTEVWAEAVHGHGGRPDLSFVAVDPSGRIVGICLNQVYPEDTAVTGRAEGVIAALGTLREARGRGVASALIAASLRAFADAGLSHAALDVDSENPTGAFQLYRGLGFEPDHRSISFDLPLDAPANGSPSGGRGPSS
ncbi:MAG TPA: GNAT family N-acetyltransferase, partial [Acidimicrobiales bacterium]|nr:GNAT family N-acetyltransferase [Acidimicrobiales bacterium]